LIWNPYNPPLQLLRKKQEAIRNIDLIMKHIVLAAGYATRLYPVTENFPKPLLEIGGLSIIDRLVRDVDTFNEIDQHLIVSNHKFFPHFEKWASTGRYTKEITLIDDGSVDNENRLGAVRDLMLAIETMQLNDDLLVTAADNIVTFSFQGFVDYFKQKQTSLIMMHYEPEISALRRTGVITIDQDNKVLEMQEKPENPKSHFAVPPFYIYKKSDVKLMQLCLSEGCHADAPGNLVRYMLNKTVFHAWPMTGKRYDVGTLETYYQLKDNLKL
jgi:glucose-1-phosphate thymidylyltransferase